MSTVLTPLAGARAAVKPCRIDPALDFTGDTAFVAVQIPISAGNIGGASAGNAGAISDPVMVVTSKRKIIPWNNRPTSGNNPFLESTFGESTFGETITSRSCPGMLEPRWSSLSIQAFLDGAPPPATAEIHRQIREYLQQYLGLRHPGEYDLLALWIMGTYLKPLFKCYPILFFNAPYESGKSRCLETIGQLSFNGKWFGEISPAGFRRFSVDHKPTFCLDEMTEVGLKNDSPLISLLLNAYNASETVLATPGRGGGGHRGAELFKVASAIAIGNVLDIKNQALESRTITIRTEYDPRFKNMNLPGADDPEPSQIRDELYRWFLGHWQGVRECYRNFPVISALSAREMDSYKPLLAIAILAAPETVAALTQWALAVKGKKALIKKATDDRFDLLLFIKSELDGRGLTEELPIISNKELADAFCKKNRLRLNYRHFLQLVSGLGVVTEIKNRSGSKYFVLSRPEIEKQLRLCESKS